MRLSSSLLALTLVAGCTRGALPNGKSCRELDAAACAAESACRVQGCPDCRGGSSFHGCVDKDDDELLACPGIACLPCSAYSDEPSCQAAGCTVGTCPDCQGGEIFGGCHEPGTKPAPVCPASCPAPCGTLDEAACSTSSSCHATYQDPGTCACAQPGCCAQFDACVEGDKADCTGPAGCAAPTPLCDGDYVISYTGPNGCYAGCVKKADCQ
jgi:hypothetical protein